MEWNDFGKRVLSRRKELNISQQELAQALGIDQAKVSLIERGARKVDLVKELPALAKVLRCSMLNLVEENTTSTSAASDPLHLLVQQYFPGVHFEDFEMRRIAQFLEPVMQSYVKSNPELEKKVVNK